MKQLFKRFDNPIFYTVSAVSIQLGFLVLFLYYLSAYSPIVDVLYTIINIFILLFLISKDDSPSYKVIWIIVIFAVPLIGGVLYLLFGNKRASQRIGMKIIKERKQSASFMQPNEHITDKMKNYNGRTAGIVHYLQNKCAYPVWENTLSIYYPIGEELYAALLVELKKARHFIFMEYFIIEPGIMWDGILTVLSEKAAQGVEVCLMYDDLGCVNTLPKDYAVALRAKGIECIPFNPVMPFLNLAMNNRDHRKITVIDGNIAFSGGVNLADEYINQKVKYGHWKDTGIKIEGDAVWNFTAMFLEMWNAFSDGNKEILKYKPNPQFLSNVQNDGYVLPFSDSPVDDETISQNVYIDILNQAENYVYIYTPYLIIDNEMQNALRIAVKRGVDVRMITPGIPDKKLVYRVTRANYGPLIKAGVKIYEYAPGFCHAKSFVSDDNLAVVGTINLDFRSLYLHFECGLLLYGTPSVLEVRNDFLETLLLCREVSSADLKQSFLWQIFDTVIRVFSPIM